MPLNSNCLLYKLQLILITFGRSDLESIEMADRVRTAVTPSVTLSEVASLVK